MITLCYVNSIPIERLGNIGSREVIKKRLRVKERLKRLAAGTEALIIFEKLIFNQYCIIRHLLD